MNSMNIDYFVRSLSRRYRISIINRTSVTVLSRESSGKFGHDAETSAAAYLREAIRLECLTNGNVCYHRININYRINVKAKYS